jgi:hypothetical protein
MRKLILAAALTGIVLTPAAHSAEPPCWAWVEKGDKLICELRGPLPDPRNLSTGTFVNDAPRPTSESYSQTTTRFGTVYSQTRSYGDR